MLTYPRIPGDNPRSIVMRKSLPLIASVLALSVSALSACSTVGGAVAGGAVGAAVGNNTGNGDAKQGAAVGAAAGAVAGTIAH
jgi:YMGG-like Gly-zipper